MFLKSVLLASITAVAMLATVPAFIESRASAAEVVADVDVSGTYTWTGGGMGGGGGGGGGGNNETTLVLKQEGTKLTGTLSGGRGGPQEIENGTVEGNKIHFTTSREFNGNKVVTEYAGTVEGESLKLTITNKRDIEAKKKA